MFVAVLKQGGTCGSDVSKKGPFTGTAYFGESKDAVVNMAMTALARNHASGYHQDEVFVGELTHKGEVPKPVVQYELVKL